MYILAIETTGPYGSVALINEKREILGHEISMDNMSHLKDLMPMIQRMMEAQGISGKDLSAIACDVGPGSFTGIRIGVSTARALAQVWDLPCVSVSSLTSVTYKADTGLFPGKDPVVSMIINARRKQIYGFIDGYLKEGPWMIGDAVRIVKEEIRGERPVLFFGDGVDSYSGILEEELGGPGSIYGFAPKEVRYQDAREIALAGLDKFLRGETLGHRKLLPEYMREAEAETKLKAGDLPISRLPKQE